MFLTQSLLFATIVSAGVIQRQSITYSTVCNAASNPNWNDCQGVFDQIDAATGSSSGYVWGPVSTGNAIVYTSGSCRLVIGFGSPGQTFENYYVVDAINDIQQDCQVAGAGGTATIATNGPQGMSVSIMNANQTPSGKKSKSKAKRDSTWVTAYVIDNAAPDSYRQQVLNGQPGGSSWSLTSSNSQTNQVQTSVSVSEDLFDIFTATESISYSYSETVSYSETSTIQNTCATDQTGFLYWYPLFTQYHGGFSGGGPSPVDIYVPVMEGDSAAGSYQIQCTQ